MSTSGVVTYNATRDQIITRALRIVNDIGEGETPDSTKLAENAIALNHLIKAMQADGMPLWETREFSITYVAGQRQYTIGLGGTYDLTQIPPLKAYQVWNRKDAGLSTQIDIPMLLVTRFDYNILSAKMNGTTPNQVFFDPPGAIGSSTQPYATVTVYPAPDATAVSNYTLVLVGQKMAEDFTAGTDTLDFPSYWINALVWGLANQIAAPTGTSLQERAYIKQMAKEEKDLALSFGTEEGSLRFQPMPTWHWERQA